jgi:hypothetical protein
MPYLSRFVSQDVACWLRAYVHRIDTHAYLSADVYWTAEGALEQRTVLFRDWLCDKMVFLDWIKRGLITRVDPAPRGSDDHLLPHAMHEVEETLEASRPMISIPLTAEAEAHHQRYRDPDRHLWYEAVVNQLTQTTANFELSLWGYKYELEGLSAPRDVFFILTDRLEARVRLRGSWSLFQESVRNVRLRLADSNALGRIRSELEGDLSTYTEFTEEGVDRLLRSLFPLLERMLREDAATRGWSTHGLRLDALLRKLEGVHVLSDDSRQLALLVAKPYRDSILHGRRLALPVARVVVVTLLDTFTRIARDLDASTGAGQTSA